MQIKKLSLFLFVVGSFYYSQAQFKIGVHAGPIISDDSDFYSAQIGADVYKMWGKQDGFLNVGIGTGFQLFPGKTVEILGEDVEFDNITFFPLVGAARLTLFGILRAGADIGYAGSTTEGVDGGFYLRPVAGVDIMDAVEINAWLQSISQDGSSLSTVGVGVLLEFGGE